MNVKSLQNRVSAIVNRYGQSLNYTKVTSAENSDKPWEGSEAESETEKLTILVLPNDGTSDTSQLLALLSGTITETSNATAYIACKDYDKVFNDAPKTSDYITYNSKNYRILNYKFYEIKGTFLLYVINLKG